MCSDKVDGVPLGFASLLGSNIPALVEGATARLRYVARAGGQRAMAGRTMACCDVPVLDILHRFRALAGIHGRYAHRAHQPPVYDHKVKAEIEDPD